MPSYLFYSWSRGSVCLPISFSGRSEDSVGFAEYVWIVGYGCDCEEEAFEGRRCKISKLADVVGSAPFKRASQCNLSQSSGRACKRRTDAPPLLQSWDRDCLRGLRPFGQGSLTPAEASCPSATPGRLLYPPTLSQGSVQHIIFIEQQAWGNSQCFESTGFFFGLAVCLDTCNGC